MIPYVTTGKVASHIKMKTKTIIAKTKLETIFEAIMPHYHQKLTQDKIPHPHHTKPHQNITQQNKATHTTLQDTTIKLSATHYTITRVFSSTASSSYPNLNLSITMYHYYYLSTHSHILSSFLPQYLLRFLTLFSVPFPPSIFYSIL